MNRIIKVLLSLMMVGTMCITSYAATFSDYWYQNGTGWSIRDGSGNTVLNSWLCDDLATGSVDTGWYLLDGNGQMYTNIIQDEKGSFYLLNPSHDGTYGMLVTTPVTINNTTFQFNTAHDGSYGRILNIEAVTQSGLPVTAVNLTGKGNLYTSQFNTSGGSSYGGSQVYDSGSQLQQQSVSARNSRGGEFTVEDGMKEIERGWDMSKFSQEFLNGYVSFS